MRAHDLGVDIPARRPDMCKLNTPRLRGSCSRHCQPLTFNHERENSLKRCGYCGRDLPHRIVYSLLLTVALPSYLSAFVPVSVRPRSTRFGPSLIYSQQPAVMEISLDQSPELGKRLPRSIHLLLRYAQLCLVLSCTFVIRRDSLLEPLRPMMEMTSSP